MDYLATLKIEAESKALPALAERVRKLQKQRAAVLDRLQNERENLARTEEHIASFKGQAAEKLARGTSAYQEFQGRLRRLKLEAETAKEALALLDAETRPAVEKELWETRGKLSQALDALCLAARPAAEARMAELVDAVVAEHDAFLAACASLHLDHGCVFVPPSFDPGPTATHPRLARCVKRTLTASAKSLSFVPPPATPAPQAAPVDAGDRQTAPGTTPTTTPDTGAVPDAAPTAVPGPETSAQDASGRTISDGAEALPYPAESFEKKATFLTGEPAPDAPPDLDAQDCAAVDAEDQAGLDAEAPPDAGEKNPGIAAELDTEAPSTPTPSETVQAADLPSA